MRVVFLGAPGSGKEKLIKAASDIWSKYSIDTCYLNDAESLAIDKDLAVGFLADYRTELFLASQRFLKLKNDNFVTDHSLIDSVCYSLFRITSLIENDVNIEESPEIMRWFTVFSAIALMYFDSFRADVVFYVREYESDPEGVNQEIDSLIRDELESDRFTYVTLEGDLEERLNTIERTIQSIQKTTSE